MNIHLSYCRCQNYRTAESTVTCAVLDLLGYGPLTPDDMLQQFGLATTSRASSNLAFSIETDIALATSFDNVDTEFGDRVFRKCMHCHEGDTGIVSYSPARYPFATKGITSRTGDGIWALQNCLAFIVRRPCAPHYEVMGPARICGPSMPDPFDVLSARGRDQTIRELMFSSSSQALLLLKW